MNKMNESYSDDDYSDEALIWREAQRINRQKKVEVEKNRRNRREEIEDEIYSR